MARKKVEENMPAGPKKLVTIEGIIRSIGPVPNRKHDPPLSFVEVGEIRSESWDELPALELIVSQERAREIGPYLFKSCRLVLEVDE